MSEDADYVPRSITGECSHCHHVFDLTQGMVCPQCLRTGVLWASNIPVKGTVSSTLRFHGPGMFTQIGRYKRAEELTKDAQAWTEVAHARMAQAGWDEVHEMRRKMYGYGLTEGDLKDVAELDKLFALRDNRD